MTLVAIDPGYSRNGQGCAVAVFEGTALVRVLFARPETVDHATLRSIGAEQVVWECPQVDSRTRVSVPAVVQLAAIGGTLAGLIAGASGATVEPVTPSAWKGSAPKPVAHGRMWDRLSDDERLLLGGEATATQIAAAKRRGAACRWDPARSPYYPATWVTHNVLDAVGIGLWKLQRTERP